MVFDQAAFPVGAEAPGLVIGRQPFGAFLDQGDGALALIETPSLAWNPRAERVVFPEIAPRSTATSSAIAIATGK